MSDARASAVIEIRALRCIATHGALEHERTIAQPFELDLVVETSCAAAGRSDELDDALDYGPLVARAARVVQESHFSLLEALAEAVADELLLEPKVTGVEVALAKLHPPLPFDVASVGVRIVRRRTEAIDGP